jgi:hypothetical protein
MNHIKLSRQTQLRVLGYQDLLWEQLQGQDD